MNTFDFFKHLNFYKFLQYFVSLFQSFRQSLDNIGEYAPVVMISAGPLSKEFVLNNFNVFEQQQGSGVFLRYLFEPYGWKMFLCLFYYALPF